MHGCSRTLGIAVVLLFLAEACARTQNQGDEPDARVVPDTSPDTGNVPVNPVCGNGFVEPGEQCDGADLNGESCQGQGFAGGALGCTAACTLDAAGCTTAGPSPIEWTVIDLGISAVSYDIARDNDDHVHLIWKESGPASLLRYGRIETGVLADAVQIPQSTEISVNNKRPRLAVAPDGSTVHTCWVSPSWENLYYVWRDASGTWRDRETVWTSAGNDWRMAAPAIGADADGTVHIVAQHWCDLSTPQPDCPGDEAQIAYFNKTVGDAWSGWTGLQPAASPEWRQCDIFTDRNGGIHAAWKSYINREGHYCHAPSGGSLAGCQPAEIPVPSNAIAVSAGSSFATDDGDVYHAMWSLASNTWTIDLAAKPAGSNAFAIIGQPSINSFPLGESYDPWPVVAVDDYDRVLVSWAFEATTVHVATFEGDAWHIEVLDNDADVPVHGRSVLAVTRQAVYVVWRTAGGLLRLAMADL